MNYSDIIWRLLDKIEELEKSSPSTKEDKSKDE